jgi:hypothetical protein
MTTVGKCPSESCTRLQVFSLADMFLSWLVIGAPDNSQEIKANIATVANYRVSGSRYVKHILWVFSGVNFPSYLLVQDQYCKDLHDRL